MPPLQHKRIAWLVGSHHPLLGTILLQAGVNAEARTCFPCVRQRIALDTPVHEWEPAEAGGDG